MKSFSIHTFHLQNSVESYIGIGRHSAFEFNNAFDGLGQNYFSFPDQKPSIEESYEKYGDKLTEVVLPVTHYLDINYMEVLRATVLKNNQTPYSNKNAILFNCSDRTQQFLIEAKYTDESLQGIGYPLKLEEQAKKIGLDIIKDLYEEGIKRTNDLNYAESTEDMLKIKEVNAEYKKLKKELGLEGKEEPKLKTKLVHRAYFEVLREVAIKHYTQTLDADESLNTINLYKRLLSVSPHQFESYFDITKPQYRKPWIIRSFNKLKSISYETLVMTLRAIPIAIVGTITFVVGLAVATTALLINLVGLIPATLALAFVKAEDPNKNKPKIENAHSDGFFKRCSNYYKNLSPWKKRASCIAAVILLIGLGVVTGGAIYAPIAGIGFTAALATILPSVGVGLVSVFGAAVSTTVASLITVGTAVLLGIWSGTGIYKFSIIPSKTKSVDATPTVIVSISIDNPIKEKRSPLSRSNSDSVISHRLEKEELDEKSYGELEKTKSSAGQDEDSEEPVEQEEQNFFVEAEKPIYGNPEIEPSTPNSTFSLSKSSNL